MDCFLRLTCRGSNRTKEKRCLRGLLIGEAHLFRRERDAMTEPTIEIAQDVLCSLEVTLVEFRNRLIDDPMHIQILRDGADAFCILQSP